MKHVLLIFLVVIVGVFTTNADAINDKDPNKKIKVGNKTLTRQELQQMFKRVNLRRTGGNIRKANSAKGYFVLINSQDEVPKQYFEKVLTIIDNQVRIQIKTLEKKGVTIHNVQKEIKNAGGQIGVLIINDSLLPALLGAPEEGWGVVNVAKLKDGADITVLGARIRREILRALGLAAGAIYAAQGDYVLQPVRKPSDLDLLKREQYGAMMLRIYPLSLPYYGLTPWDQTTYIKACEEGWAPAPTNEYQKAIWDKVHAMPKNPMKIEFDPKKGR